MNKETRYINIYRGFAIICMVITRMVFVDYRITNVLNAFWLCMLFMAEGAELAHISKGNSGKMQISIKDMAVKFMVPYAAFSLVALFAYSVSILMKKQEYTTRTLKAMVVDVVTLYGHSVLWILSAFFVAFVIYAFIRKSWKPVVALLGSGVLMSAYLLCGNIFDYMNPYNTIFISIVLKIFALLWRSVFGVLFISLGEVVTDIVIKGGSRKRNIRVPLAFVLIIIGCIVAFYNNGVNIEYLRMGNPAMFYGSAIMISVGFLFIAEWIGIFRILEFVGINGLIVLVTYIDFRIMYVGTLINSGVLAKANNRFVAHACQCIAIIVLEVALIFLFAKVLPFMMGRESSNPFGLWKQDESDEVE